MANERHPVVQFWPQIVMAASVIGTAGVMIYRVNSFESKMTGIESALNTLNETMIRRENDGRRLDTAEARIFSLEKDLILVKVKAGLD